MLRTAVKNLAAHRARLAMTAVAVVLGVGLMAGTLVLTDTVGRTFDDLVADINRDTDAVVRSSETVTADFGDEVRGPLDGAVLPAVEALPEVAVAEGVVQVAGITIVGPDGHATRSGNGAPALGMSWTTHDELNPFTLVDGQAPDSVDEVVIDRASARAAGVGPGDRVTITSTVAPRSFRVSGVVTFGAADSPAGASVAAFTLPVARELAGIGDTFTEISVVAADGVEQTEVVGAIESVLPPGAEALTGDAKTAEDQQEFADGLAFFNTFLLAFAFIALFVGSFIIANTFSIIVAQRGKELALLRALGASRRQVLGSVLAEALLVGVVASTVGAAAGVGIAAGLKQLLAAFGVDIPAGATVVTTSSLGVAVATGTTITVLAAVLPAWRAAKVAPVAALRDVALDTSASSRARTIAGLVITLAGVAGLWAGLAGATGNTALSVGAGAAGVFVGVATLGPVVARPAALGLGLPLRLRGVTGALARQNAARSPRRTASSAAALMVGVALVASITIFAASGKASIAQVIDASVSGDAVLSSDGVVGFSPELTDTVRAIDGVEVATPVRITPAEVDGAGTYLSGVDTVVMPGVADPQPATGDLATLGADGIAVSTRKAEADGLALGDVLEVRTETGTWPLTVEATYDNAALAGDIVVDLSAWERLVSAPRDFQTFVTFGDGADPAAVVTAMEEAAASYGAVEVQNLSEYKATQYAQIDQLLNLIYALLFLAVLIALLGIANTLALSVHERTRELGLLRAVGMSRAQLRATIRWESVIIALLGAGLGLAVGLGFGWALVRALEGQGITVLRLPVAALSVVVALAGIAGVVAGVGPARRAARLDVLRAVTTE